MYTWTISYTCILASHCHSVIALKETPRGHTDGLCWQGVTEIAHYFPLYMLRYFVHVDTCEMWFVHVYMVKAGHTILLVWTWIPNLKFTITCVFYHMHVVKSLNSILYLSWDTNCLADVVCWGKNTCFSMYHVMSEPRTSEQILYCKQQTLKGLETKMNIPFFLVLIILELQQVWSSNWPPTATLHSKTSRFTYRSINHSKENTKIMKSSQHSEKHSKIRKLQIIPKNISMSRNHTSIQETFHTSLLCTQPAP